MQKEITNKQKKYSKTMEVNICGDYLVTIGAAAGVAAAGIAAAGIAAVAAAVGAGNTSHRA
jgi:hypothetical protein